MKTYDITTGEGQKRLFYDVQLGYDSGPTKFVNLNAPGDYGADPIGNGNFRMVPSGDVVDFAERNKRMYAHSMTTLTYQEALLAKEAKSTQARGGERMGATLNIQSDKEVECPECGIPNPVNRMTCEICHKPLRVATERGGEIMDEMAKELYGMNKKLKTAVAAGDQKLQTRVKAQIKAAVAKSGGVFKVGEQGLATQAKSTTPKPKAEKKPKVTRECPCCGKKVGGYFAMGHDGRVHGMLIKIGLGKMKVAEAPEGVRKMYPIWSKDHDQSMKEVAAKIQ